MHYELSRSVSASPVNEDEPYRVSPYSFSFSTLVAKPALKELKTLGIAFEAHIMSAHRTPALTAGFGRDARKNVFGVIIAVAGMAAHGKEALSPLTRSAAFFPCFHALVRHVHSCIFT